MKKKLVCFCTVSLMLIGIISQKAQAVYYGFGCIASNTVDGDYGITHYVNLYVDRTSSSGGFRFYGATTHQGLGYYAQHGYTNCRIESGNYVVKETGRTKAHLVDGSYISETSIIQDSDNVYHYRAHAYCGIDMSL